MKKLDNFRKTEIRSETQQKMRPVAALLITITVILLLFIKSAEFFCLSYDV